MLQPPNHTQADAPAPVRSKGTEAPLSEWAATVRHIRRCVQPPNGACRRSWGSVCLATAALPRVPPTSCGGLAADSCLVFELLDRTSDLGIDNPKVAGQPARDPRLTRDRARCGRWHSRERFGQPRRAARGREGARRRQSSLRSLESPSRELLRSLGLLVRGGRPVGRRVSLASASVHVTSSREPRRASAKVIRTSAPLPSGIS